MSGIEDWVVLGYISEADWFVETRRGFLRANVLAWLIHWEEDWGLKLRLKDLLFLNCIASLFLFSSLYNFLVG